MQAWITNYEFNSERSHNTGVKTPTDFMTKVKYTHACRL